MVALAIAKFVMRLAEARPAEPDMKNAGDYQEIFRHPMFTEATPSEQQKIMLASARARYDDEMAYPWDLYFGRDLCEELQGPVRLT